MAESKRTEVNDFKIRAYRTVSESDKKFQNYRDATMVQFDLVVEIDGIEIPILSQTIPWSQWDRSVKNYGKDFTQA